MSQLRSTAGRRQELAWLITIPVAALAATLIVPLVLRSSFVPQHLPAAFLFLGLFILADITVLHFEVRRHAFTLTLTDIPLLLALVYLPPLYVISVRVVSLLLVQAYQRITIVKLCLNLAAVALGTAVASLIVEANLVLGANSPRDVGPRSWGILAAAVVASTAISLATVISVISLVQRFPPPKSLIRMMLSVLTVTTINITVSLVVLVMINVQAWSALLLVLLGAILVVVYRSYAQFVSQHRSLTELYELTRAMGDASRDGTLPDVLLGRVRELLQAEYATLWLPSQGRYPELHLSARVDSPGLLDDGNTPAALRERALADAATVLVGPRMGDPRLRTLLKDHGIKDAVVVPLRSGSALIGSLEVTGRLGDQKRFGPADVRLLETLAAQVAVAVENSRLVDRLRFDAYHDALTGLPNRRRLLALLEEAVKVRAPGEVVAILVFDIDGVRDVNDSLGHEAGDQMVREVAERLRRLAPAAALVGRASSDEFVVTLRLADDEEAMSLAASLRRAMQEPMRVGSITLDIDVAVGVAVHPEHGIEAEVLLRRADLAAQSAKLSAQPIQLYVPSLQARSTHRLGLAADLRRSLDARELEVYFQPKVALPERRVVGVECLARWEHPAHGSVPPAEFVPVAENTGLMGKLTELVLRQGLAQARKWADAGTPLPIAVNLSPRTLIDPTLPRQVGELLEEYAVAASLLTLEITEDRVVREPDRPLSTLQRLSEMGVRIAVDDFGTGYSSLSYLRRLPVNEVKIDRSFVQGMATDTGDLAIVRAVVDLARHFGLGVVAEGVESERTVSLLEELGCDTGQGFLFSRPLPVERFEAWLHSNTEPAEPDSPVVPVARRLRVVP